MTDERIHDVLHFIAFLLGVGVPMVVGCLFTLLGILATLKERLPK